MDDALYGRRDKRGDWKPFQRITYPAVFTLPPEPCGVLKWLFGADGYLWPWNTLYAVLAVVTWFWLTPPLEAMRTLTPGWIALILMRNAAIIAVFYGTLHLWLYIRQSQGTSFKFNGRWPDRDNRRFLFGRQTAENLIWTFGSALPVWTAYEVVTWWAQANGYIPSLNPAAHPVLFAAILFLIPLFREVHFYLVHRLLHWPPLYRLAHSVHHHNVNPGPWSGLSMHPVEHLLYFSSVLIHWIVPSHPIHVMFHLLHLGLTPAPGHVGFERMVLSKNSAIDTHSYAHYLHHKYFECNYADGTIPLDRWFGTLHDGSDEGQEAMKLRLRAKVARASRAMG